VIEQVGVVVSVRGGLAEIEAERRRACGGCAAGTACSTSLIARYLGRRPVLLRARNSIGAAPGDRVVIGLPEGVLLEASFLAYLVPLLTMIGGAMAGESIGGALLTPAYAQGLSVAAGLGGLVAGLAWLVVLGRAKFLDKRYQPRMLRPAGGVGASRLVSMQERDFPGRHHTL